MVLRIEYDYQIFSLQRYGGISRYYSEIAARLAAHPGVEAEINCPLYINEYLRALPPSLVHGRPVEAYRRTARLRHWLNASLGRRRTLVRAPLIRHLTYYRTHPSPGPATVVTVYDMAHERFPGEFPAKDATSREKAEAVRSADAVICISHHTRKELLDLLPVDPAKVFVTHLGFTPLRAPTGFSPPSMLVESPYLLYVGNRGGYKNFEALLKAYGSCRALAKDHGLVCLGGGRFTPDEERLIASLGVRDRVMQSQADDALLAYAYAHARAFVYPSIYEGFGIPPLEAMSCGCPVICGSNSSLAEVVGDAAYLVDPSDEGSLAKGLEAVAGSEAVRERLVRAGSERAAKFSWDTCAEETLAVYRAVAGMRSPAPPRAATSLNPRAGQP